MNLGKIMHEAKEPIFKQIIQKLTNSRTQVFSLVKSEVRCGSIQNSLEWQKFAFY